jgi:2-iminobutanoate/2-iminopropanoate deaminase
MRTIVRTDQAPQPLGPYSQAVVANGFVFVSSLQGRDPATNKYVSADVGDQTRQALRNLDTVLRAAGSDLQHIVHMHWGLVFGSDYPAFNKACAEFFSDNPPARSGWQLQGDSPYPELRVSIGCVAILKA